MLWGRLVCTAHLSVGSGFSTQEAKGCVRSVNALSTVRRRTSGHSSRFLLHRRCTSGVPQKAKTKRTEGKEESKKANRGRSGERTGKQTRGEEWRQDMGRSPRGQAARRSRLKQHESKRGKKRASSD